MLYWGRDMQYPTDALLCAISRQPVNVELDRSPDGKGRPVHEAYYYKRITPGYSSKRPGLRPVKFRLIDLNFTKESLALRSARFGYAQRVLGTAGMVRDACFRQRLSGTPLRP
jgi:hypothetical protein